MSECSSAIHHWHLRSTFSRSWNSSFSSTLHWRHNGHDGVSNHQCHNCLFNRLFWHRSKKTSKLRITGLCAGNSPVVGEFPQKWSVMRKTFPFDDVIMRSYELTGFLMVTSLMQWIMTQSLVFRRCRSDLVGFNTITLHWRHNERNGVSNHQPHECLLNRLFSRRLSKTSKLRVIGLCEGNSPVTSEFPAQRASNAENVSIDDVIMFGWIQHDKDIIKPMITDYELYLLIDTNSNLSQCSF